MSCMINNSWYCHSGIITSQYQDSNCLSLICWLFSNILTIINNINIKMLIGCNSHWCRFNSYLSQTFKYFNNKSHICGYSSIGRAVSVCSQTTVTRLKTCHFHRTLYDIFFITHRKFNFTHFFFFFLLTNNRLLTFLSAGLTVCVVILFILSIFLSESFDSYHNPPIAIIDPKLCMVEYAQTKQVVETVWALQKKFLVIGKRFKR